MTEGAFPTVGRPPWLEAGEEVLWTGKPAPLRFALRRGLGPFLFGLAFLPISVSLIHLNAESAEFARRVRQSDPIFEYGAGLSSYLFAFAALCGLLWPIWLAARAGRTSYALTTRRAVIEVRAPFPRRISLPLRQLRFVELRSSGGRFGDVVFQEALRPGLDGFGPRADGFIAIPDPAQVESLLRATLDRQFGNASQDGSR